MHLLLHPVGAVTCGFQHMAQDKPVKITWRMKSIALEGAIKTMVQRQTGQMDV